MASNKTKIITVEEVKKVRIKQGKNEGKFFYVLIDEDENEYSTFDKKVNEYLKDNEGEEVELKYLENGDYLNIVNVDDQFEDKKPMPSKRKKGGYSGGNNWNDPARQASIEWQSCRGNAVAVINALIAADKIEVSDDPLEIHADFILPLQEAMYKTSPGKEDNEDKKEKKKSAKRGKAKSKGKKDQDTDDDDPFEDDED